jgi:hypothetical protein
MGAFLLMAVTGMLMFFEWEHGLIVVVHQWSSWMLVLGAGGHIVANFRPLKNHLKSRWGMVSVATFSALLVVSLFSWGLVTGPAMKRTIEQALVDAPLSQLIRMSHVDTATVTERLKSEGIDASSEASISDLARNNNQDENRLLALVFLPADAGK